MCGIALIVSGIRIDLSSSIVVQSPNPEPMSKILTKLFNQPTSAETRTRQLRQQEGHNKSLSSVEDRELVSAVIEDCEIGNEQSFLQSCFSGKNGNYTQLGNSIGELQFIGATLQLRGLNPIIQPFVDSSGNVLIYNGEIFGSIHVDSDRNDGEVLMQTLAKCCYFDSDGHGGAWSFAGHGCSSVPEILSTIKGPWAIIYWQRVQGPCGLVEMHPPACSLAYCERFSVSAIFSITIFFCLSEFWYIKLDFEVENGTSHNYWEELSCGIHSLSMDASKLDGYLAGEVKKHEWSNAMLAELIKWDKVSVSPKPKELHRQCNETLVGQHHMHPASSGILTFESVRQGEHVPVAVLFSGRLDSIIIAALLDECLDPSYGIDILNVSFDGQNAPDRISAKAGVKELRRIAPLRRWKLVEIDSDLSNLTLEMKHVMSLINPANTYMDLNIGIALWLAASGDGWISEGPSNNSDENQQRLRFRSEARIVLVGSGADEQCAGYGRHRSKYRCGGWHGLNEEMKLDMQRIWKRNMGRDDRCIADNGKEARFPFLDEDVITALLDVPLWEVANLDQPSGTGDKKILREVAQMLGLHEAAILPKRAIQVCVTLSCFYLGLLYRPDPSARWIREGMVKVLDLRSFLPLRFKFGSRIARESNRNFFGSNRAANQASAGSVVINRS